MRRAAALLLAAATLVAAPVAADDQREGYYYPAVSSEEAFTRTLVPIDPPAGRDVRVGFVTTVTKAQLAAPEAPRIAIFAKGGEAEHMIVVALDDAVFSTLYRARAVMAQLTANARGSEFFVNAGIEATATWFDLAKMLGFETIVLSDGHHWAHRVVLRPEG